MQAAAFVNSHGMLDYEPNPSEEGQRPLIAILGGERFDCPTLQISQQVQGWLRKLFWFEDRLHITTRKFATVKSDAAFLHHAVKCQMSERCPDVWVLHVWGGLVSKPPFALPTFWRAFRGSPLKALLADLELSGAPVIFVADDISSEAPFQIERLIELVLDGLDSQCVIKLSDIERAHRPRDGFHQLDQQHHLILAREIKRLCQEFICNGAANQRS